MFKYIKYNLSICMFICSVFTLNAQGNANAKQLMDRWIQIIQSRGISAKFTIKSFEGKNLISQEISGDIVMKGNQLYFDTEELSLWFNGTTQWVYFKETHEVNITTPTADELAQTNPMIAISGYSSKFTLQLINQADVHHYTIKMTPKNENFEELIVKFNKKTTCYNPSNCKEKLPQHMKLLLQITNKMHLFIQKCLFLMHRNLKELF